MLAKHKLENIGLQHAAHFGPKPATLDVTNQGYFAEATERIPKRAPGAPAK